MRYLAASMCLAFTLTTMACDDQTPSRRPRPKDSQPVTLPDCVASCDEGLYRCTENTLEHCRFVEGCFRWYVEGCNPGYSCDERQCVPATCIDGTTLACPARGECRNGVRTCTGGSYGTCVWEIEPSPELCDQRDNNCDGAVDNDAVAQLCDEQRGVCAGAQATCTPTGNVCDQANLEAAAEANDAIFQTLETSCDGDDNDCDGQVDENANCGSNARCVTGTCECLANAHRCGNSCVLNNAVASCGSRCVPCPTDPHGTASCVSEMCELSCDPGYHLCGTSCKADNDPLACGYYCTVCPTDPLGLPSCQGGLCALTCNSGSLMCNGACRACPEGFAAYACNGSQCVNTGTLCAAGYHRDNATCRAWVQDVVPGTAHATQLRLAMAGAVPHVLFIETTDGVTGTLRHATRNPDWQVTDIANDLVLSSRTGRHIDLATDPAGNPHICFHMPHGVGYAQGLDGTFTIMAGPPPEPGVQVEYGQWCAIAVDSLGRPHVAYITGDGTTGTLTYGMLQGDTWSRHDFTGLTAPGRDVRIAVDPDNRAHIAFDNGNWAYAYQDQFGWSPGSVPTIAGGGQGREPDIDSYSDLGHYLNVTVSHDGNRVLYALQPWSTPWETLVVFTAPEGVTVARPSLAGTHGYGYAKVVFASSQGPWYAEQQYLDYVWPFVATPLLPPGGAGGDWATIADGGNTIALDGPNGEVILVE